MTVLLVLIAAFTLFIFVFLRLVLWLFSKVGIKTPEAPKPLPARLKLKYLALPLLALVLSVGMVIWFYGKLPSEVASSFASDGTASGFTTRVMLVFWALLPQVCLALLSFGVAWGVTRVGAVAQAVEDAGMKVDNLLLVMGNMVALPQLVLGFAMLNTFGYNAYGTRLVPIWLVVLIVMGAGAVALGVFFIGALRRVYAETGSDKQ